jgi:hypothetical protein
MRSALSRTTASSTGRGATSRISSLAAD